MPLASGLVLPSKAVCPLLFGMLCPCLPGLTSKSKKGNSESFLELAPREACLCWGGQRGREGPRKAREESRGQTKGPVHL